MAQGVLPFYYETEKTASGMTAFAGLPLYLDLAHAVGLRRAIERHVRGRTGNQGYTDSQIIHSLILLNLAGGESVDDINMLEHDAGLNRLIRHIEWTNTSRPQRRALEKNWRQKRTRALPSPSSIFRFLALFHDPEQETLREQARQTEKAFIPAPTKPLQGLYQVNRALAGFAQRNSPQKTATLDMDATLVATSKSQALWCYKGFQSYQPLNTYWVEQGLTLHSEFRDGNVPAGYQQLRVLRESLALLPESVEKVNMRSDTAAYQWDLLKYCAEGKSERFGIIDFVVGGDVTPEFKRAVAEVEAPSWTPFGKEMNGTVVDRGQEYAEVVFVPNAIAHKKKGPEYRFLAIREPLPEQLTLAGFPTHEQLPLPFPTVELSAATESRRFKLYCLVTNRWDLTGPEVIQWYRARCGKSEEVHQVMKADLCGGRLPSGDFGENAAWWAIMVVAMNLYVLMNRLVLGGHWVSKRLKAVRFGIICIAGRVMWQARQMRVRLDAEGKHLSLFLRVREKILNFMVEQGA